MCFTRCFFFFFCYFAGREAERSGLIGDVPFPDEESRVVADQNKQLHLPESILGRD